MDDLAGLRLNDKVYTMERGGGCLRCDLNNNESCDMSSSIYLMCSSMSKYLFKRLPERHWKEVTENG